MTSTLLGYASIFTAILVAIFLVLKLPPISYAILAVIIGIPLISSIYSIHNHFSNLITRHTECSKELDNIIDGILLGILSDSDEIRGIYGNKIVKLVENGNILLGEFKPDDELNKLIFEKSYKK